MNIVSTMRTVGADSDQSSLPVHERSAREIADVTYKMPGLDGNYEKALDAARKYIASAMQGGRGIISAIHYAEAKSGITKNERNKLGIDSFLGRKFDYFRSEYMVKNTNSAGAADRWNVENLYEWALSEEEFKAARAESTAKRLAQYKIDFDASVKRIEQERRDAAVAQVKAREAVEAARKEKLAAEMRARNVERSLRSSEFDAANARLAEFQKTSADKFTADNAAIAQAITNPAASALQTSLAGTDTRVVPTTVTVPDSSSSSTPSTGTSPLTIAAIGFGVLKLLAII